MSADLSKSTDGVIYAFHDTQEPRLLKTKQNVKTMTSAEIDATGVLQQHRRAQAESTSSVLKKW